MVATYRADGSRLSINKRVREYTGRSSPEDWSRTVHPDDIEPAESKWRACIASGEPFEHEYRVRQADGTLVPRTEPGALLTDPEEAAGQALSLARDRFVLAQDGSRIAVEADTICVHGDTPGAPEIARRIRERFRREGIAVSAFDRGARRQEGVR